MSLLTENNRQYYEGAQGFLGDGNSIDFTTTFDTDLVYGNYSPTNVDYALNNFKLYISTSGIPGNWTEYTKPYMVSGNTITIGGKGFIYNLAAPNSVNFIQITKSTFTGGVNVGDRVSAPGITWDGTGSISPTTSAIITSINETSLYYEVFWNPAIYGNATYSPGVAVTIVALEQNEQIVVQLKKLNGGNYGNTLTDKAFGNIVEDNYGSYSYTKLNDVINNFLVAYVGAGKLIPNVKRTDVVFHAKRAMQEFSYDTLKSINSQELTIPKNLSVVLPQDYVNYVNFYWIDSQGVKHIIMPTNNLNGNPYDIPIQDNLGVPIQDNFNNDITGTSLIEKRWKDNQLKNLNNNLLNNANSGYELDYIYSLQSFGYGQLYGMDPQYANANGYFNINEREGKISFSANLVERIIMFEYVSDGLSTDLNTRVPKMAEEAIYAYISHAVIASRINQPEYVVQRLKREKSAKLRNAKIRLSNIKLNEIVQVMRGKSKWIKH